MSVSFGYCYCPGFNPRRPWRPVLLRDGQVEVFGPFDARIAILGGYRTASEAREEALSYTTGADATAWFGLVTTPHGPVLADRNVQARLGGKVSAMAQTLANNKRARDRAARAIEAQALQSLLS